MSNSKYKNFIEPELKWDYTGWATSRTFFGDQRDWHHTLLTKINEISAQIHMSTLKGPANFVVVSPEVSAMLEDLEYYSINDDKAMINGREITVDEYQPINEVDVVREEDDNIIYGKVVISNFMATPSTDEIPSVSLKLETKQVKCETFKVVDDLIQKADKSIDTKEDDGEVSDAVKEWLGIKPKTKRVEDKDYSYSASTTGNLMFDFDDDDDDDDVLDAENDIHDDLYDGDTTSDLTVVGGDGISVTPNKNGRIYAVSSSDPHKVLFEVTNDDGESVFKVKNNGEVEIGIHNYQQGGQPLGNFKV